MNASDFKGTFLRTINKFRKDPNCIYDLLSGYRLNMKKFFSRKNEQMIKSIEQLMNSLNSLSKCKVELKENDTLNKSAAAFLKTIRKKDYNYETLIYGKTVKNKVPEDYDDQDCVIFADCCVEVADRYLIKILMNTSDKENIGKKVIRSEEYTQIGMAFELFDDDDDSTGRFVVIFAKKNGEEEKKKLLRARRKLEVKLPEGDLSELKQSFDLFDNKKEGIINPKEVVASMKAINFYDTNPQLFKLMEELISKGDEIDYPTYAWHFVNKTSDKETKDGLKTIFNLFVDDFENNTISLFALKKICKKLADKEAEQEVNYLINSKNNIQTLTFDDFYSFMMTKKLNKV